MRIFTLNIELPFLRMGKAFSFDYDTGFIYAILDGKVSEYPLRSGLAGYLWLLLTENDKYLSEL